MQIILFRNQTDFPFCRAFPSRCRSATKRINTLSRLDYGHNRICDENADFLYTKMSFSCCYLTIKSFKMLRSGLLARRPVNELGPLVTESTKPEGGCRFPSVSVC